MISFTELISAITLPDITRKGISSFNRRLKSPQIVWGLFDSNGLTSCFYVVIKPRCPILKPELLPRQITLNIRSRNNQPSDIQVRITKWLTTTGCEHLQTVRLHETNLVDLKKISFDLPAYALFRITITALGNQSGHLLAEDLTLTLEAENARVLYKPYSPPYSKYIISNRYRY